VLHRSFSVEAKRCENEANNFSLRSAINQFFRLFRFEAKYLQIKAKRNGAKKNSKNKSQIAQNLIKLPPPPSHA
jgi:hypothetical protein